MNQSQIFNLLLAQFFVLINSCGKYLHLTVSVCCFVPSTVFFWKQLPTPPENDAIRTMRVNQSCKVVVRTHQQCAETHYKAAKKWGLLQIKIAIIAALTKAPSQVGWNLNPFSDDKELSFFMPTIHSFVSRYAIDHCMFSMML